MENDYIRTNVRSVRGERGRDINYLRQCMDNVVGDSTTRGERNGTVVKCEGGENGRCL